METSVKFSIKQLTLKQRIIIVINVLILATVGFLLLQMHDHNIRTKASSARSANQPLPVDTHFVKAGPLDSSMPVECTLEANSLISIYPPKSTIDPDLSTVLSTYVKVGQQVKKGQLLLQLDPVLEENEIRRIQTEINFLAAEVEAHKKAVEWADKNVKHGLDVMDKYHRNVFESLAADTALNDAKLRLDREMEDLERKKILASQDGIIMEVLQPSQTSLRHKAIALVVLGTVDKLLAKCQLNEDQMRLVEPGQVADVSFYSIPGKTYHSSVSYIDPKVSADQRLATITIELNNSDHTLLPGSHGIALLKRQKNALRIPSFLLLDAANLNEAHVFVVDNQQKAHFRKIETGISADGYTEVVKGLNAGEQIIVSGHGDVHDGDSVRILSTTEQARNNQ